MIASDDVRRVTFERIMRGYRCEDVDDYLKQVADAMDALTQENEELQNKIRILGQRIDQYRSEEDTLRTTMINAQRMGENVIKEAKQNAAEMIRAANIKADDREQRARDEVELSQQEIITLKHEANAFKKTLLDNYRVHIEMLSKMPEYEEEADLTEQQEPDTEGTKYVDPLPEPETEQPASSTKTEEEAQQSSEVESKDAEETKPAKRVDTVEFAIAPSDEDDAEDNASPAEDQIDDQADDMTREHQVSALFGNGVGTLGASAAPGKSRGKSTSKSNAKAKGSRQEQPSDDLPAAFDSFEGVDFES